MNTRGLEADTIKNEALQHTTNFTINVLNVKKCKLNTLKNMSKVKILQNFLSFELFRSLTPT